MNQVLQLTLGKQLLPVCLPVQLADAAVLLCSLPCLGTSTCLFNFSFPLNSAPISWCVGESGYSWLDVGQSNGHPDAVVLSSAAVPLSHMSRGENSLETVTMAALGQTEHPPGLMSCLQ